MNSSQKFIVLTSCTIWVRGYVQSASKNGLPTASSRAIFPGILLIFTVSFVLRFKAILKSSFCLRCCIGGDEQKDVGANVNH